MDRDKRCEQIIEKHYAEIFRHCLYLLRDDIYGAEDCTQDVFLLLLQKKSKLDFNKNIRAWLYLTAERIVMNYIRKRLRSQQVPVQEIDQFANSAAMPDNMFCSSAYGELTDQELHLLTDYYSASQGDREIIAEKYGMTVRQLYKQIHILRERIKKKMQE